MAVLAALDPLLRGGAIALFALWTVNLWRFGRGAPAARAAMAMNLAILAYLIAPVIARNHGARAAFLLCDAVSIMAPVLFWLFARLWFDDRAAIGWRSWLVLGGFGLVPVVQISLIYGYGHASLVLWSLARIGMFAASITGMWIAWRGRAGDLVEPRRNLRLVVVGLIGFFALWVSGLGMFGNAADGSDPGREGTLLAIFIATLAASSGMSQFRPTDLFAPRAPAPHAPATRPAQPAGQSRLARRVLLVMGEERLYRAEGFSLSALAQQLAEPEHRVRRAINSELGHRNFTAFLNGFRLDEVRVALADPAQREVPILTIALDAGFGSIGPFNRAFREAEGVTPTAYRAARLAAGNGADVEIG